MFIWISFVALLLYIRIQSFRFLYSIPCSLTPFRQIQREMPVLLTQDSILSEPLPLAKIILSIIL